MIEKAEKSGLIAPGKTTVIEYTSGNTGIGLAMVCAAKGYSCIIVMPQIPTMTERFVICRKFGAQVHLTAASKGLPGMKDHVEKLLAENPGKYWCPRQFENPANPEIHHDTTGPEIWSQSGGKVDYFISGIGTGGTLVGTGRFLKEQNPHAVIIGVEPTESRIHVGGVHSKHTVVGIGPGVIAGFVEELAPGQPMAGGARGVVDEFLCASSEESVEWANRLAREEGLLVGPSTGCVMKVAAEVAGRPEAAGKTIVVIFPSSGVRYLAHPMWSAERTEAVAALPLAPNMDPEPLLKFASSPV
jgi:cysteine synthase A